MHKCHTLVVACIDFRFQKSLDAWLGSHVRQGTYDRVGLAGGVKNWAAIAEQVGISKRLHAIERVILINHEDCGAYGEAGTLERHSADLRQAREKILRQYPDMQVDLYYAQLDGEWGGSLTPIAY